MREIKFRAWNKTTKNMLDVTFMKFNPEFARMEVSDWSKTDTMADEYELMQYTGLKDKNGVEIYEGDIVKATAVEEFKESTKVSDIVFNSDGGWVVRTGTEYQHGLAIEWGGWESIEVIGNIYENPELLKGGDIQ